MGDPLDDETEIGPQARSDLRDALHAQVEASLAKGARCLLGGKIPDGPRRVLSGRRCLTDVRPGMPAYDEELFGPVAAIIPVRTEAEAIAVANDSPFGLGGAVITRDLARGERIAAELIEAAAFSSTNRCARTPRLPFGGIKDSGYGRELSSYGIREFVNVKTVYVA